MRLRPFAFATFLVLRLRIGACGVGACDFGAYDSYPKFSLIKHLKFRVNHLKIPEAFGISRVLLLATVASSTSS